MSVWNFLFKLPQIVFSNLLYESTYPCENSSFKSSTIFFTSVCAVFYIVSILFLNVKSNAFKAIIETEVAMMTENWKPKYEADKHLLKKNLIITIEKWHLTCVESK